MTQTGFTLIWQSEDPIEYEWILELLHPYIASSIVDGAHQVVQDNSILCDKFIQARDPTYYARFKGLNAYLFHLGDEFYDGHYEIYQNFKGVIRQFWTGCFDESRVMTVPLGYTSGHRSQTPPVAASKRPLAWSFVGEAKKSSRPEMEKALRSVQPSRLITTDGSKKHLSPHEFGKLLDESQFAPCPMGNVNLESFRVYEALEHGSIPIVEKRATLDYFQRLLGSHPIPTVRYWSEAHDLIMRLGADREKMDLLQKECWSWWARHKSEVSRHVGQFVRANEGTQAGICRSYSSAANSRLWQAFELLRHHSAPAISRRVYKHLRRFAAERRLRIAYTAGSQRLP